MTPQIEAAIARIVNMAELLGDAKICGNAETRNQLASDLAQERAALALAIEAECKAQWQAGYDSCAAAAAYGEW